MKVLKTIKAELSSGKGKTIFIGFPEKRSEFEDMHKFRNKVYVKKGYIDKTFFHNGKDVDEYDKKGKCVYFIAMVDNKIIGTVRTIQSEYLPTEKDCFDFEEPNTIKLIARTNRREIGRLVVLKYSNTEYFPRHIVMLGMLDEIVKYFRQNNVHGGYSFIKNKLRKKLRTIGAPFHIIKPFRQKYNGNVLHSYFNDPRDIVCPIFFITEEMEKYSKIACNHFFEKISVNEYEAKRMNIVNKMSLIVKLLIQKKKIRK